MSEPLEQTVRDHYIISINEEKEATKKLRFETLLQRVEQLGREYGPERFAYAKFDYVKAVAATIKDAGIVAKLEEEGYEVRQQGKLSSS